MPLAMRSRSNSGVRLDYYQRLVYRSILNFQDPITGLIPSQKFDHHAWVRDNVYCIISVWALSMAYKKYAELDEDRAKTYELEQSCVKLMRGLLLAMMKQKDKVERFKESFSVLDCLHAKYSVVTGAPCVGDAEWGHLQLDATSLYLLVLAQMTASGIQIVFNLDEVAFIQNLVFYIESSYCIPDYGIWERGDKTNHGLPELNASSIGMAKAALEAMNELDLFGARGGHASVIHVLADEAQKCDAVLKSMLPRESNSKEVDAALLAIIGFPAFAVSDPDLINLTRDTIVNKLQGQFGCKRFLRDGYKTAKEDPTRLYYNPSELSIFENIECEWPLFFCNIIINAIFCGDTNLVEEYSEMLEKVLIRTTDGFTLVPEMYAVPPDRVQEEYVLPHSQDRDPIGQIPFMWAQSLFVLGRLLHEGFIAPGELDPLNRRFASQKQPEVVVQVVVLAEDSEVRDLIKPLFPCIQSVADVSPIEVHPARVLSHIYSVLGWNRKMGLSGRASTDIGLLSTSKLYTLQDCVYAFMPQNLDVEEFHLVNDIELFSSTLRSDIAVLRSNWHMLGRPTMVVVLHNKQMEVDSAVNKKRVPAAIRVTLKKLQSGYIHGTRVVTSTINDFLSTSCISSLSFLGMTEEGNPQLLNPEIRDFLDKERRKVFLNQPGAVLSKVCPPRTQITSARTRKTGVTGLISRSRLMVPRPSRVEAEPDDLQVPNVKAVSDLSFEKINEKELLKTYQETELLEEKGDILYYLATKKGLTWDTGIGYPDSIVTVRDLFQQFYDSTCQEKKWGLVRHFANCLGKRVEDLAKSMTDLLVRQKQVTVGIPSENEHTFTRPLNTKELRVIINKVYARDQSTAMLTQELIVYLAMFIRTEPELFKEMLRLRVGLIIQVMASELSRSLKCSDEEAMDALLSLSPFDMKTLLRNILAGKEFTIKSVQGATAGTGAFSIGHSTRKSQIESIAAKHGRSSMTGSPPSVGSLNAEFSRVMPTMDDESDEDDYRAGVWLRRRRLDGALNRVPANFYPDVWGIISRCDAISVAGHCLNNALTKEMTPGELKFALQVETVLNYIPEPEYRQLIVESLMVLALIVEQDALRRLGGVLYIEGIVHTAHRLFLEDQLKFKGNATLCCSPPEGEPPKLPCHRIASICQHFYDSAPSGCYGTMTYLVRAAALTLSSTTNTKNMSELDCMES